VPPSTVVASVHVASIAVATAITVGTALLVFASLRPRRVAESAPAQVHDAGQVTERLAYVIARAAGSPVAPMRLPAHPRSHVQSQYITKSSPRAQTSSEAVIPPSIAPSGVADTGTGSPPRTVPPLAAPKAAAPSELTTGVARWWTTFGRAPAFGNAKGLFHRDAEPMDFDSALRVVRDSLYDEFAAGRPRSVPLTQAERDAQWRAQALAAFAERNIGELNPRAISAGASVSIGLPFGGPSHETRERDRAIYAQTKEIQARIQRRVDSTLAARRQRHVDSLARVDHQTRSASPD
jgi:hypothetical protein